nr:homeobox domain protein [uncultured bacterium]
MNDSSSITELPEWLPVKSGRAKLNSLLTGGFAMVMIVILTLWAILTDPEASPILRYPGLFLAAAALVVVALATRTELTMRVGLTPEYIEVWYGEHKWRSISWHDLDYVTIHPEKGRAAKKLYKFRLTATKPPVVTSIFWRKVEIKNIATVVITANQNEGQRLVAALNARAPRICFGETYFADTV